MRLPKGTEGQRLAQGIIYPLGDRLTAVETLRLGAASPGLRVGAVMAKEFRPVRPGEWYFSGAEVAAYRAPLGMSYSYHIARLVIYRVIEIVEVVDVCH